MRFSKGASGQNEDRVYRLPDERVKEMEKSASNDNETLVLEPEEAPSVGVRRNVGLTKEEEQALGWRILEGDETAVQELVEGNVWLVRRMAQRFASFGVPKDDLICEGVLGLMHAAQRYNPTKNARFATYAHWWVKRALIRTVLAESGAVNLPLAKAESLFAIKKAEADLTQKKGREVGGNEIAAIMGISWGDVEAIRHASESHVSLDEPTASGETTRRENIVDDTTVTGEDVLLTKERHGELYEAVERLPEREKYIVKRRYGLDALETTSFVELARDLGISRQRVQQIERRALGRLKAEIEVN